MATFEQMSMSLFAVILMVNIGLTAMGSVGGVPAVSEQGFGQGLNYTDLNASFNNLAAENPQTQATCTGNIVFCGIIGLGQSVSNFSIWLGYASNIAFFFMQYLPQLLFGYHLALMNIAGLFETGIGPLTMILTGIDAVIFIIVIYGIWGIVKSIASLVPGVG